MIFLGNEVIVGCCFFRVFVSISRIIVVGSGRVFLVGGFLTGRSWLLVGVIVGCFFGSFVLWYGLFF